MSIFSKLINESPKTQVRICEELKGSSKDQISDWARGQRPGAKWAPKLAEYFGVTVDEIAWQTQPTDLENAVEKIRAVVVGEIAWIQEIDDEPKAAELAEMLFQIEDILAQSPLAVDRNPPKTSVVLAEIAKNY